MTDNGGNYISPICPICGKWKLGSTISGKFTDADFCFGHDYPLDNKVEWYGPESFQTGGRDDPTLLIKRQAAALATIRNMIEGRNSIDDPEKRLVMADGLMDEILMVIAEAGDGSDLPNSET